MKIKLYWAGFLFSLLLMAACGAATTDAPTEPAAPFVLDEPPAHAANTLAVLQSADPPIRDLSNLALRLKGVEDVLPIAPAAVQVGDIKTFWYMVGANTSTQTSAELRLQSDNLNLWIEDGAQVSDRALRQALVELDDRIVPNTRAFFGHEGDIAGDSRINILHLETIGKNGARTKVAGYFRVEDLFPLAVADYSNERKMLYVGLDSGAVGSHEYYQVIAHEFQHMIQASTDLNESTWVDEGMSELAAYVNGYNEGRAVKIYGEQTDVQLTDWETGTTTSLAHYGASFLYHAYFLERFGDQNMQALVRQQSNGLSGVDQLLGSLGQPMSADAFFGDWVVANYLTGIQRETPPYAYRNLSFDALQLTAEHSRLPVAEAAQVHQYGVDYLRVNADEPVVFEFTGSRQSQLMPIGPLNGDYFVTTYPADRSDMMLTRAFDFTSVGAETLTLSFSTWYQIEKGWDYGYVLVSADNGATWQMMESIYSTAANPHGNNYGIGLTGKSGLESDPVWTEMQIDLSAFIGENVLIRFEYVTDAAVAEAGWAIDDIQIAEVDYLETFENGLGSWELLGWARHSNILPQSFILQAIYLSNEAVRVEPLVLGANQQGRFTLDLTRQFNEVVITVSGSAPVTKQPAAYRYTLSQ